MTTHQIPPEIAQMDDPAPFYAIGIIMLYFVIRYFYDKWKYKELEKDEEERRKLMQLRKNNRYNK